MGPLINSGVTMKCSQLHCLKQKQSSNSQQLKGKNV